MPANSLNTARVVFCTCPGEEVADTLARALVKARLAACVNILPKITSVYSWKGEIQSDQEALMVIKTCQARYPELEQWLKTNHPYEVPEVLALPVEAGLPAYLDWIEEETC